jgi:predicted ATPase
MWEMSDGELAFVALLSLIYGPAELGAGLYCIEEPENHLHKRQGATIVTYPRDKAHLREPLQNEELGLGDLVYSGALQGG